MKFNEQELIELCDNLKELLYERAELETDLKMRDNFLTAHVQMDVLKTLVYWFSQFQTLMNYVNK